MWKRLLLLLALSMFGSASAASVGYLYDDEGSRPIVEVTEPSLLDFASTPTSIVLFYSPTCGACIRFKDTYIAFAKLVTDKYQDAIAVYAVSCDAGSQRKLCQDFKITMYPTLQLTSNGGKDWTPLKKTRLTDTLQLDAILAEQKKSLISLDKPHPVHKPVHVDPSKVKPVPKLEDDEEDDEEDDDEGEDDEEDVDREDEGDNENEADSMPDKSELQTLEEEQAESDAAFGIESEHEDETDASIENGEVVAAAVNDEDSGDKDEDDGEDMDDEDEDEEDDTGMPKDGLDVQEGEDDEEEDEEEDEDPGDEGEDEENESEDFGGRHSSGQFPHFPETRPGAAKARLKGKPGDVSIMDRLSQRLREKGGREKLSKPGFFNRKPKHHGRLDKIVLREGATDNMAAHKPHTKEYLDRRAQILKTIAAKKGKDASEKVKQRWKEMEESQGKVRLPYKKKVKKPRLAEKVPLVKNMVKLAPEEEMMTDTSLSLIHGLRYGVYKLSGPLTADKKRTLADWLELLSVTLPEEWGVHDVIEDLMINLNTISKSEASFQKILRRHTMERKAWSSSCMKSGPDYAPTCGFWKLLHVMSIGLAEHRGGQTLIDSGLRRPDTRLFSPLQAADVLRDYIKYFFLCDPCSKNFLSTYEDCTRNRRCDRLARDAAAATDEDWKEMGTWLWEVHNDVNMRVMKEKAKEKRDRSFRASSISSIDTIAALWPTLEDCIKCFQDDGSWNEDALFVYLELEYWPDQSDSKMSRLLSFEDDFLYQNSSFGLFWVLLVLIVVLAYAMQQNKSALQQAMLSARVRGTLATQKRSV